MTRSFCLLGAWLVAQFVAASAQSLYVSNAGLDQVTAYNGATGTILPPIPFASGPGPNSPHSPMGLAFSRWDRNLYVTSFLGQILKYDGRTGAFLSVFVANDPTTNGGLVLPRGLTFGPDLNLYVSDFANNNVLEYNGLTGAFIRVFASGHGLTGPYGLVFGPDQHLYVTSTFKVNTTPNQVLEFGNNGDFIRVFVTSGSGGLNLPIGVRFSPWDRSLLVTSNGTAQVLRYDGKTGAPLAPFVDTASGGLDEPWDLVFGPDLNLYVTNNAIGQVLKYNGITGAFIPPAFVDKVPAPLFGPTFLTFYPVTPLP